MKFFRLAFLVIFSAGFTSCSQTWAAFKNTYPVRILDQTGSALLGYIAENDLPANGKPASMQERARQVEMRGIYAAGKTAPTVAAPRQSMVSR
ncbi:hypothetical protein [Prosthecobacter sp.]|uniref:hypothetical protein n=1 Tax=Prosthecobacter sp. TaxID=1965333 RepID=UPI002488A0CB|nr:hypothetical protein [Prosthecobacter sp.]MDI1311567.1 hypothetical protein [Prosthecobacter sp.]